MRRPKRRETSCRESAADEVRKKERNNIMFLSKKEVNFIESRISDLQYQAETCMHESDRIEYLDLISQLNLVLQHDQALQLNELFESQKYERWEV